MKYDLITYILLFFTYSIAGWCMEVVRIYFNPQIHKFINRGFLIGPYLPIYGSGVVAITIFLGKYSNDLPALFLLSIIVCGILEYLTSYIMEKIFNARWWDYSNRKFNINGRVCLENLIPFGLAGTIILHWINPFIVNLYDKIPILPKNIISAVLVIGFSIDTTISLVIMAKFKNSADAVDLSEDDDTENISKFVKETAKDVAMEFESTVRRETRKRKLKTQRKILHLKIKANKKNEEFTRQIKEKFAKRNILNRRLMNAFPDVTVIRKKLKKT